jgi:glycerol-3-phosphate responsive antiterminator
LAQDLLELIKKYGVEQHIKLVHDENPDVLYADPGKLMPIIVKAIQDLDRQLTEVRQDLANLKLLP